MTSKDKLNELAVEIKNMHRSIIELTSQLAVNTHILNEHHKRSNMLEAQMEPLQEDLKHRQKLWTLTMGSSGIIALVSLAVAILALLHKQ